MKLSHSKRPKTLESLVILLVAAAPALAQVGVLPNAPSQQSTAVQLPLSGSPSQIGGVTAVQEPVAGTTTSVNTLNTSVQAFGPFAGSVSGLAKAPFAGTLSFIDAIRRGLEFNLGTEGITQAIRQAQGQSKVVRSGLLPNLDATASETVEQVNLQTIGDMTAWQNYRSAQEIVRANERALKDARDLVVLAVGGSYLQVAAAKQRVLSEQAQLDTATALFNQASQQRGVGLLAQTDVNRSRIQMLTEQERLETLKNDLAKQKINLARMIGLPANDQFDISDTIPFSAGPAIDIDGALKNAYSRREDLKAAESQLRASQLTRSAP